MALASPPSGNGRMRPNSEQLAIATAARAGRTFKILAGAGTGKSTTLRLIAHVVRPKKILYLVYNSANAVEGRLRFRAYPHVTVSTIHSLAFQRFGKNLESRIEKRTVAIRDAVMRAYRAELMRLSSEPEKALDAVMATLQAFQNGPDSEISAKHVPNLSILGSPAKIAALAAAIFADQTSPDGSLPLLHDTYAKYFQAVLRPRLDAEYDIILLDEGQDSNPLTLALLEDQQCQKIIVGDSHQSLYGFRQAVNAMESLRWEALPLTQSWRYGESVATLANEILRYKGETLKLRGAPGRDTQILLNAPEGMVPGFVLCRTNAGLFEVALDCVRLKWPFTIVRGVGEMVSMVLGAYELWLHGKSTHPEFRYFRSWKELENAARGPSGADYKPFVRIVDLHENTIPDKCAAITDGVGGEGAIRLSTLHSAKGLEDDIVFLGNDWAPFCAFDPKRKTIVFYPEEANVVYVASTRAKKVLVLGDVFAHILHQSFENAARLMQMPPSPPLDAFLTGGVTR